MESVDATPSLPPVFQSILGFIPGAVGGACNVIVGYPIDLVKVRQQTRMMTPASIANNRTGNGKLIPPPPRKGTLRMLRHVAVYEGLAGLYSGVTAPLLGVVPACGLTFGAYETARQVQLAQTHRDELTLGQTAMAGACSGITLASVIGPLDRIKCNMQVHPTRYSGLLDCAQKLYAEGGLRSMFRGTGVTLLRDMPGNAAYFVTCGIIKRTFYDHVHHPSTVSTTLMTLFAGGMAGTMRWIVAIPMDVVKSRWQTAQNGTYRGPLHVLRVLLETDGPRALFRGLGPALMRAFPANAACLLGVETASALMKRALGDAF